MLHFYTFQCFRFAFFSRCNLRMLQFLPAALCSFCIEQRAAGSIVAIFSILDARGGSGYAFTIVMFYFFHVALFYVALVPCSVFFMLHSCCTVFSFHVALFPCWTCLLLKNFENERETENTTKERSYI